MREIFPRRVIPWLAIVGAIACADQLDPSARSQPLQPLGPEARALRAPEGPARPWVGALGNATGPIAAAGAEATAVAAPGYFLVWENLTSGERGAWTMSGTTFTNRYDLLYRGSIDPAWRIAAIADFNGDGQEDLLWRHSGTGDVGIWPMNGTTWSDQFVPVASVNTEWEVAAAADFTGDGKPDIVWQNTRTGERGIWVMNGMAPSGQYRLLYPQLVPTHWDIAAAADMNGDGLTDLVWQNQATGERGAWLMNGTQFTAYASLYSRYVPLEWQIVGAYDVDGDGKADLLWQQSRTGERGAWIMNGTSFVRYELLYQGYVSTQWNIAGMMRSAGQPQRPAAPSGLSATGASSTEIDLRWMDNSGNEDGFTVEQCAGASCTNFTTVATLPANATSHRRPGLAPSSPYGFRVRAFNTAGASGFTSASASTLAPPPVPPAAPSALHATAHGSTQIDLSWADNSDNETGFRLERCTGNGCTNFSLLTEPGVNVRSYADQGLAPATTYCYRVQARNGAGSSTWAVGCGATDPAPIAAPKAPSNLTGEATSYAAADLHWTDNSDNEDGFAIYRCIGTCTNFVLVATVGPNVTSYRDESVSAATTYLYRIRAFNAGGNSSWAAAISVEVPPAPPAQPSGLAATPVSSTRIDLTWTDASANEDGFRVERCIGQGCTSFSVIATMAANATGYQNTGLSPVTKYSYRVRAFNAGGNSGYAGPVVATTPDDPPAAPTSLVATAVSSSQVNLSWADRSNNEDGFKVERCAGTGCSAFTQIAIVGPNATTYQNTGLSGSTPYSYRVRAYNSVGNSPYSTTASATTSPTTETAYISLWVNSSGQLLVSTNVPRWMQKDIWVYYEDDEPVVPSTATACGRALVLWPAGLDDATHIWLSEYNGITEKKGLYVDPTTTSVSVKVTAVQGTVLGTTSASSDRKNTALGFSFGTSCGTQTRIMDSSYLLSGQTNSLYLGWADNVFGLDYAMGVQDVTWTFNGWKVQVSNVQASRQGDGRVVRVAPRTTGESPPK
ncbi:MAG TPA: fibronectin type III domain-containing protein [Gemmatimonadaceae bacterium]